MRFQSCSSSPGERPNPRLSASFTRRLFQVCRDTAIELMGAIVSVLRVKIRKLLGITLRNPTTQLGYRAGSCFLARLNRSATNPAVFSHANQSPHRT